MESGKSFFKPEQIESGKRSQEALDGAKDKAKAGKRPPVSLLDAEIISLRARRKQIAENLKLPPDAPILKEFQASIKRIRNVNVQKAGWKKLEKKEK